MMTSAPFKCQTARLVDFSGHVPQSVVILVWWMQDHKVGEQYQTVILLRGEMESPSFALYFPSKHWRWPSFHALTGHLYRNICCGEISIQTLYVGLFLYYLIVISWYLLNTSIQTFVLQVFSPILSFYFLRWYHLKHSVYFW